MNVFQHALVILICAFLMLTLHGCATINVQPASRELKQHSLTRVPTDALYTTRLALDQQELSRNTIAGTVHADVTRTITTYGSYQTVVVMEKAPYLMPLAGTFNKQDMLIGDLLLSPILAPLDVVLSPVQMWAVSDINSLSPEQRHALLNGRFDPSLFSSREKYEGLQAMSSPEFFWTQNSTLGNV